MAPGSNGSATNDTAATNSRSSGGHKGTACTDEDTQGGHFFEGASDPWASIVYPSTTSEGSAAFSFSLQTTATDIAQKPFIIHNNAGVRVACGMLSEVAGLKSALLSQIESSGVN